jgi:hypothetical protein
LEVPWAQAIMIGLFIGASVTLEPHCPPHELAGTLHDILF